MTMNITVSNMVDYIFTGMIVGFVDRITVSDSLRRLPPLAALIISWLIIRPAAKYEFAQKKDRTLSTDIVTLDSTLSGSLRQNSFVNVNQRRNGSSVVSTQLPTFEYLLDR
jgi:hypothetical protein